MGRPLAYLTSITLLLLTMSHYFLASNAKPTIEDHPIVVHSASHLKPVKLPPKRSDDRTTISKTIDINNNSTIDSRASNPADKTSVKVESKTGRLLSRMQGKRQINTADAPSRRNEDPWFLDQEPYPLQPYRFVYNIKGKNGQTEQYRQEVGDGKFLTGSYGYVLPDGIYRHVDYIADDRGFRAFIRTSEPGTANENPSNVQIAATPVIQPPGYSYSSIRAPDTLPAPIPTYRGDLPGGGDTFYGTPLKIDPSVTETPLVRRPPGSIVGTSLRNFTSFSFTTPSPLLVPSFDYRPVLEPPALNGSRSSFKSDNSLPHYWGQISDDEAFARINRQRLLAQSLDSWHRPQLSTLNNTESSSRSTFESNLTPPNSGTFSAGHIPRQQFETSRRISEQLPYDTPLTISRANLGGSNKLTYDRYQPDPPYLSLERARSLAQINQLNAINPIGGLQYIRPLLTNQGEISQLPKQIISHSSWYSKQEEDHHRHQTLSQLEPDGGSTTKEHKSGLQSGSAREFEIHKTTNHELPPPPQPSFPALSSFQNRLPTSGGGGGVKGGPSGNSPGKLQAPYTGLSQSQQRDEFPTFEVQKSAGIKTEALPLTTPAPPAPPSPPPEPKPSTSQQSEQSAESTKSSPDSGQRDRSSSGAIKGQEITNEREKRRSSSDLAWLNELQRADSPSKSVRLVRMPDETDYRSTVLMNDLRSMQNMIGLPQPPRRLNHDSSSPDPLRISSGLAPLSNRFAVHHSPDERLNSRLDSTISDQIVSARLSRLDALMERANQLKQQNGTNSHHMNPAASTNNRQAASNQRASIAPLVESLPFKAHNKLDDDVPRLSTGPVIKSPKGSSVSSNRTMEPGGLLDMEHLNELSIDDGILVKAANETFDARRLDANKRSMQTEKVSELEKFQQRLRAQRLFLEQARNSEQIINNKHQGTAANNNNNNDNKPSSAKNQSSISIEPNSHVKYDEDSQGGESLISSGGNSSANKSLKLQIYKSLEPSSDHATSLANQRDFPRIRRQPEVDSSNEQVSAHTTTKPITGSKKDENNKTPDQEPSIITRARQRKLTIVQSGQLIGPQKEEKLTEFAKQIQRWPSIVQLGAINRSSSDAGSSSYSSGNLIETNQIKLKNQKRAHESNLAERSPDVASKEESSDGKETKSNNQTSSAINMNFLHSVTSLSAHQLNPFSVSSVNLVQPDENNNNTPRQQPTNSSQSPAMAVGTNLAISSNPMGVATSQARYQNSAELLAALDYHEQRDTSGQLKSLLPSDDSLANNEQSSFTLATTGAISKSNHQSHQMAEPTAAALVAGSWASNHRYQRSTGSAAPYAYNNNNEQQSMSEAATNRSFVSLPRPGSNGADNKTPKPARIPLKQPSLTSSVLSRDGFEIRDHTLQLDNERFYEVVASSSSSSSSALNKNNNNQIQANDHFQAFRDMQLSIPAMEAAR